LKGFKLPVPYFITDSTHLVKGDGFVESGGWTQRELPIDTGKCGDGARQSPARALAGGALRDGGLGESVPPGRHQHVHAIMRAPGDVEGVVASGCADLPTTSCSTGTGPSTARSGSAGATAARRDRRRVDPPRAPR
jgi:hypothetical protein